MSIILSGSKLSILESLTKHGWVAISRTDILEFDSVISMLEPVRFQKNTIQANVKGLSRPNSLSSRFGLDEFPLHTDCAQELVPPRFVVLDFVQPRNAPTYVYDSKSISECLRSRAVFVDSVKGRQTYRKFQSICHGAVVTRYNRAIFRPVTPAASRLDQILHGSQDCSEIDWQKNAIAVIDNHRMLHGRGTARADLGAVGNRAWIWI